MARVIPVPLLSLFTPYELETMVCGSPDIPLNLLKSVATYKGDTQINVYVDNGGFFHVLIASPIRTDSSTAADFLKLTIIATDTCVMKIKIKAAD